MTDLSLRERLALAVERALPFSNPDDIGFERRKMIDAAADNVTAELLAYLTDYGLAIVPVTITNAMDVALEDDLGEQYGEHPEWDEAKEVIEGLDLKRLIATTIKAAPPAASLLTKDKP